MTASSSVSGKDDPANGFRKRPDHRGDCTRTPRGNSELLSASGSQNLVSSASYHSLRSSCGTTEPLRSRILTHIIIEALHNCSSHLLRACHRSARKLVKAGTHRCSSALKGQGIRPLSLVPLHSRPPATSTSMSIVKQPRPIAVETLRHVREFQYVLSAEWFRTGLCWTSRWPVTEVAVVVAVVLRSVPAKYRWLAGGSARHWTPAKARATSVHGSTTRPVGRSGAVTSSGHPSHTPDRLAPSFS
jgi:hypothetical protein